MCIGKKRRWLVGALALTGSVAGFANQKIEISDIPLFVSKGVAPNVYLTFDDSGSMEWHFIPDSIVISYEDEEGTELNPHRKVRSSHYNRLYYNPNIVYEPPIDGNGNSLGNANFAAAWKDGYDRSGRHLVVTDLRTSFLAEWLPSITRLATIGTPERAHYFVFNPQNAAACAESGGEEWNICYDKVVVQTDEEANFANWYAYYRNRSRQLKAVASLAFRDFPSDARLAFTTINRLENKVVRPFDQAHRVEFYDWVLSLPAIGVTPLREAVIHVGDYFSTTGANNPYRVVPGDANSPTQECLRSYHLLMTDGVWTNTGYLTTNVDNEARQLPENDFGITSYLPGRRINNIYSDLTQSTLADLVFQYWSTDLQPEIANSLPEIIVDQTSDINENGTVNRFDIFWNPRNNPATWQGMSYMIVGMGVSGTLDYDGTTYGGDYPNLLRGTAFDEVNGKDWPDVYPSADGQGSTLLGPGVDDLWHAAINGRGQYFGAFDLEELNEAFSEIIEGFAQQAGSASSAALSGPSATSGAFVFRSVFDTSSFSGKLFLQEISDGVSDAQDRCPDISIGEICTTPVWEAGCRLYGGTVEVTNGDLADSVCHQGVPVNPNDRVLITFNPETGQAVPFRWDNISDSQRTQLGEGTDSGATEQARQRLAYIRGDQTHEDVSPYNFRPRTSQLGTIINSTPIFIGAPNRVYRPDQFNESSQVDFSYNVFKQANANRTPVVAVGANDGMLHLFEVDTGREILGYVPSTVYAKLKDYTTTSGASLAFVDGEITVEDAKLSGGWRSVLVAGMGRGGNGLFALDVTNIGTLSSETTAADLFLWEFADPDLGTMVGAAQIFRLRSESAGGDRWVAAFGNGYNNAGADGDAALFVIDLESGELIRKISTMTGSAEDPSEAGRINGITDVRFADVDNDSFVDYVYGGDLFGNLWKFDLRAADSSNWSIAYGTATAPLPLFVARGPNDEVQPVVGAPVIGHHPLGIGQIVVFGTGKYLGQPDLENTDTQSIYGVWDREANHVSFSRTHLLQQEILGTDQKFSSNELTARGLSAHPMVWHDPAARSLPTAESGGYLGWFIDLPETGERAQGRITIRNGRVMFITVTPTGSICEAAGSSWFMEVDLASGGRSKNPVFDYNGDGKIDHNDQLNLTDPTSGEQISGSGVQLIDGGIYTNPQTLMIGTQIEKRIISTSVPNVFAPSVRGIVNHPSIWRQLLAE